MVPIHKALAAIVSSGLLVSAASAGVTTFSDGTFDPADWTEVTIQIASGGVSAAEQQLTGGNTGAYRKTNLAVDFRDVEPSVVISFNHKHGASYDPAVSGALVSLDYSEDAILFSGFNEGQATGPAVQQGDQTYYYSGSLVANDAEWTTKTATGLTASDFRLALDPNAHPDFSPTGGVLLLGYYRSNVAVGEGYTTSAGIDNWSLIITSANGETPAVPLPPTILMGLITMTGAVVGGYVSRRRRV